MEDGTIVLVGARPRTLPSSRKRRSSPAPACSFSKPLDAAALESLLGRAGRSKAVLPRSDARRSLIRMADGDGRAALTLAEGLARSAVG